jgi:hypothetical protein
MNRLSPIGLCVVLSVFSAQGWAQTVVPMKGQIRNRPNSTSMNATASPPVVHRRPRRLPVDGSRARRRGGRQGHGGAGSGNQHDEIYDRVDDNTKQDYRQNRAKQTAAAGAVVGGSRQRQERRAQEKTNASTTSTAYTSCLQGKGYQVNP